MQTPYRWIIVGSLISVSSACSEYQFKAQTDVDTPGDTAAVEIAEGGPTIGVSLDGLCASSTFGVYISSLGDAPLIIETITVAGSGWGIENPPELPIPVFPGEEQRLDLVSGDGPGTLYIQSDDPDTPVLEVPLEAQGDSPPLLEITSHVDGQVIDPGGRTEFVAMVSETEDALEDLVVEWSSNVDGPLATTTPGSDGTALFSWDGGSRSSGRHILTAATVDSCENEAIDQIEICQNEGYIEDSLDLSTWNFEGDATWDVENGWVQLTDTGDYRAGTAFQTSTTVPSDNVVIDFSFYVSGGTGADGISLTALDTTRMTGFVGSSGGGIGYAGLPGWSIEVDTWYNSENNDPTEEDHLSIHLDGNSGSYVTWATLPEMEDGLWHDMSVTVSGTRMIVVVDGVTYIDENISGLGAFPAYVGFTGATGSMTNWHLIDSLEVGAFVCDE